MNYKAKDFFYLPPRPLGTPPPSEEGNLDTILQQFHELIKQKLRIRRPAGSFRMELCREPGIPFMFNALIRPVVHIDEQRFPIFRQRSVVHCITMILRSDEATLRAHHTHRLVVTAMTLFQLVYLCSSCLAQQLISHADTEDR